MNHVAAIFLIAINLPKKFQDNILQHYRDTFQTEVWRTERMKTISINPPTPAMHTQTHAHTSGLLNHLDR